MSFAKDVIAALKQLNLPAGEYCLFGGSSLAIRGIRPTPDIDLFVTPQLYEELKKRGWKEVFVKKGMYCLESKSNGLESEACKTCGEDDTWIPNIQEYINNPEVVEGIPFMSLKALYEWKADTARQRDLDDLKLIDDYWAADTIR